MSRSKPYLSADVWLGPMEGIGFSVGTTEPEPTIRVGRQAADKRRGLKNNLVLSLGIGISSTHAEVAYVNRRLLLRDLGSTNGTFVALHKVTEEIEVEPGEVFLAAFTPVRVDLTLAPRVELPPPRGITPLTWPEPGLSRLVTVSREAAERRSETYMDTRHLCEAVLTSKSDVIRAILDQARLSPEEALAELWQGTFLQGTNAWLSNVASQAIRVPDAVKEFLISPRANTMVEVAIERSRGADAFEAEVLKEILREILDDPAGPVGLWLRSRGVQLAPPGPAEAAALEGTQRFEAPPPRTTGRLVIVQKPVEAPEPSRTSLETVRPLEIAPAPQIPTPPLTPRPVVMEAPPAPPPEPARPAPVEEALEARVSGTRVTRVPEARVVEPPTPAPAPVPVTAPPPVAVAVPKAPVAPAPKVQPYPSTDLVVDPKARELAEELSRLATEYRFSTAEDRRTALRDRITRELHSIAADKRPRLIEQLRVQFPVVQTVAVALPKVSPEEEHLARRVKELERQLEEARTKSLGKTTTVKKLSTLELPWDQVLPGKEHGRSPSTDPRVEVLGELVEFAISLERFVLGLVESIHSGGGTAVFRLPNFSRENLLHFLNLARAGKEINTDRLQEYVAELQRWQVSILAAHHEAPKQWFAKLWKRISPTIIESATKEAGWKLRGESADWWNLYKQTVKDLTPDVVQDQILQMVSRVAQEEFSKLKKGSKSDA